MQAVRISEEHDRRLARLADLTGRSKTYYVREAIEQFLEDREDRYIALQRLEEAKRGKTETISLDELEKELGLED